MHIIFLAIVLIVAQPAEILEPQIHEWKPLASGLIMIQHVPGDNWLVYSSKLVSCPAVAGEGEIFLMVGDNEACYIVWAEPVGMMVADQFVPTTDKTYRGER